MMASAERELGAFMGAVSEVFGAEHARRAAVTGSTSLSGWIHCLRSEGISCRSRSGGSALGNLAQCRRAIR